jgi:hypothetical protein
MLLGIALISINYHGNLIFWVTGGSIIGLFFLVFYVFVFCKSNALIPLATSAYFIMFHIQNIILNPYSGAEFYAGITIILLTIIAISWYIMLQKNTSAVVYKNETTL